MKYLVSSEKSPPFLSIRRAGNERLQWERNGILKTEEITETVEKDGEQVEKTTKRVIELDGQVQFIAGIFDEDELPDRNEYGVYTKVPNEEGTAFIDTPQEKLDEGREVFQRQRALATVSTSKQYLADTDYVVLKKAEGVLNDTQINQMYPDLLSKRTAARTAINDAEATLQQLSNHAQS